jgi:hypothetical protein
MQSNQDRMEQAYHLRGFGSSAVGAGPRMSISPGSPRHGLCPHVERRGVRGVPVDSLFATAGPEELRELSRWVAVIRLLCLNKRSFNGAPWPGQRLSPFLKVFSLKKPSQVTLPPKAIGAVESET